MLLMCQKATQKPDDRILQHEEHHKGVSPGRQTTEYSPVQAGSSGQAHARHVTRSRNKGTVAGVFWTSTWKVVLDMCCADEKMNQWCWICTCALQARRWQAGRQRLPRQEMPQRCRKGCGSRPGSGSPSHLAHTPPHPAAQQKSHPGESPVAVHPADPLIF